MSDLSEFIDPDTVVAQVSAGSRKALFQQLGAIAGAQYGLDQKQVAEGLAEREQRGSTGFGGGFAMPHARLAGLNRVVGLFVQLSRPIDFDAVDDLPVDLFFALLSPDDAGVRHLKALAGVSRAMREQSVRARLRGAATSDALYALLVEVDARDAA